MAVALGPMGHHSVTVSSTAIGLTLTDKEGAQAAVLTLETNPIRYTVDGTTPTSTVGHLAQAGGQIELFGREELRRFLAIRTGSDATLKVTLFRDYHA